MPTYTYECDECGVRVDRARPIEYRDYPELCAKCEDGVLVRQLDAPMVNMAGHEAAGRKGTK